MSGGSRTPSRKSGVGKKILYVFTSLLGVVVILLSVAYGGFRHYYGKMNIMNDEDFEYVSQIDIREGEDVDYTKVTDGDLKRLDVYDTPEEQEELVYDYSDPDITNIMLVGTDSRKKGLWRTASDAMVLVSINKKTKKVFLSSFMRDTLVDIRKGGNHKEAGKAKLNAAFAYGGSKMMFQTYEDNFGIKIDKYVHFDFFSFINIVNYIGGIDMYVKADEVKYMNTVYIFEINVITGVWPHTKDYLPEKTGMVHLNGKQALAYTRVRYTGGGDFGRTERQRKMIEAIVAKVKKLSPSKLSSFAERSLRNVSTNLTETDVMSLLVGAPEFFDYEMISTRIPIDKTYHSDKLQGAYVLVADLKKNADYWYSLVYLDKDISADIAKQVAEEKKQKEAEKEQKADEQDTASSDTTSSSG